MSSASDPARVVVREIAGDEEIPELTRLLHAAYASLGERGWNYTAVDQPERVTRERIRRGTCLVAHERRLVGHELRLVGTVTLSPPGASAACALYERPGTATIGQLAVHPDRQRGGIGRRLLREAERRAADAGATVVALDTAEGATHLIAWYEREDYAIVDAVRWPGKTYRSVVMVKNLAFGADGGAAAAPPEDQTSV